MTNLLRTTRTKLFQNRSRFVEKMTKNTSWCVFKSTLEIQETMSCIMLLIAVSHLSFENRLRYDKVTESLKVGIFFETL